MREIYIAFVEIKVWSSDIFCICNTNNILKRWARPAADPESGLCSGRLFAIGERPGLAAVGAWTPPDYLGRPRRTSGRHRRG